MYIFIMRHGEAANIDVEDSRRPLTKKGVIEAQKMGRWLADHKLPKIKVFVSPYLRAQQSCENVVTAIKDLKSSHEITPETLNFITPSGDSQQVHDFIDGLSHLCNTLEKDNVPTEESILLVSHMPFVSYLVGELTNSTNMPIFATGAIATIDYDIKKMQGQLIDLVCPNNACC